MALRQCRIAQRVGIESDMDPHWRTNATQGEALSITRWMHEITADHLR